MTTMPPPQLQPNPDGTYTIPGQPTQPEPHPWWVDPNKPLPPGFANWEAFASWWLSHYPPDNGSGLNGVAPLPPGMQQQLNQNLNNYVQNLYGNPQLPPTIPNQNPNGPFTIDAYPGANTTENNGYNAWWGPNGWQLPIGNVKPPPGYVSPFDGNTPGAGDLKPPPGNYPPSSVTGNSAITGIFGGGQGPYQATDGLSYVLPTGPGTAKSSSAAPPYQPPQPPPPNWHPDPLPPQQPPRQPPQQQPLNWHPDPLPQQPQPVPSAPPPPQGGTGHMVRGVATMMAKKQRQKMQKKRKGR
jgi:hypothetical protein